LALHKGEIGLHRLYFKRSKFAPYNGLNSNLKIWQFMAGFSLSSGLSLQVVFTNGFIGYLNLFFTSIVSATICNGGRTASEFHTQGTGTGLWIQNGTNPVAHSITIPKTVADADASKWTKGACFVTMGTPKNIKTI
jgi:hypothetical protein